MILVNFRDMFITECLQKYSEYLLKVSIYRLIRKINTLHFEDLSTTKCCLTLCMYQDNNCGPFLPNQCWTIHICSLYNKLLIKIHRYLAVYFDFNSVNFLVKFKCVILLLFLVSSSSKWFLDVFVAQFLFQHKCPNIFACVN